MAVMKRVKVKQSVMLDADQNEKVLAINVAEYRGSVSATIAMLVREAIGARGAKTNEIPITTSRHILHNGRG